MNIIAFAFTTEPPRLSVRACFTEFACLRMRFRKFTRGLCFTQKANAEVQSASLASIDMQESGAADNIIHHVRIFVIGDVQKSHAETDAVAVPRHPPLHGYVGFEERGESMIVDGAW